jgi:hypothetical protein
LESDYSGGALRVKGKIKQQGSIGPAEATALSLQALRLGDRPAQRMAGSVYSRLIKLLYKIGCEMKKSLFY